MSGISPSKILTLYFVEGIKKKLDTPIFVLIDQTTIIELSGKQN
jgi:hypothetical protein